MACSSAIPCFQVLSARFDESSQLAILLLLLLLFIFLFIYLFIYLSFFLSFFTYLFAWETRKFNIFGKIYLQGLQGVALEREF